MKFDLRFCLWILGRTWSALTALSSNYSYILSDQATGRKVESHYCVPQSVLVTRNTLPPKLKYENECTDFKHDQIWHVVYESIKQKLLDCQHNSWIVQHSSAPKLSEILAVCFHCRHRTQIEASKMKWNLILESSTQASEAHRQGWKERWKIYSSKSIIPKSAVRVE